jgi:hypothetical protein
MDHRLNFSSTAGTRLADLRGDDAMRRPFAALAVVPVLAFSLTACGGGGKDAVAKAAASKSSDLESMRKFAQCMRQNGVDMPDPTDDGRVLMKASGKPGAGGLDKMTAAENKCRHFQPNGGKPVKPKPEELAKMRAMAKCMREHGVDMPDPDENGRVTITRQSGGKGTGTGNGGPDVNPDSPTFKAADKACRQYAPGRVGQQGNSTNKSGGGS